MLDFSVSGDASGQMARYEFALNAFRSLECINSEAAGD